MLAAVVGLFAFGLTAGFISGLESADTSLVPWPVLAIGFVVAERVIVHFEFRRDSHAVSFSAVPLVVGLYELSPITLVATAVGGLGVALLSRRQAPLKLVMNLAAAWIHVAVTVSVFRLLVDAPEPHPATWGPAILAVVAGDFVQAAVISAAIALHQRSVRLDPNVFALGAFQAVANSALALVAVVLLESEPWTLLLLGSLLPVLFASYRVHARLREQHQNLAELHDFSRSITSAVLEDTVAPTLLRGVTELMNADRAWLWFEREPDGLLRVRAGEDGGAVADHTSASSAEARLHRVAHDEGAPLIVRAADGNAAGDALAELGASEALIAPVERGSGPAATVVAVDRGGEVRSFGPRDLTLFATLVNHASASLENSRLLERLREEAATNEYQATHDALTDLPNREAFQKTVSAALERHPMVAVLLLDLDRFKEINDTLGHHNGDLLLQEVGGRLRSVLRADDVVARLGGDEFAILLTGISSTAAAVGTARSVPGAFEQPFELSGMTIAVGASVGIAVSPDHGTDAATLLQRADVAMYACKASGNAVELYDPETDVHSAARLALANELREAVDTRELEVYFQPQVDLRDGHPAGAEALVRWPRMQASITPAEIVSVAEHTGLMRPLTMLVLGAAARECRRWWDLGWPIRVSVNISARSLLDENFVDEITAELNEAGLPPKGLCIELTETTVVAEGARVLPVLERLRGLGVSISLDDFGTGYSSLSYLSRLPVDEIKIDKSFVLAMPTDPAAEAIVRTILDLAVNLGLPVVAEGIETAQVQARLSELGCGAGQGYHFSRPVPADDFLQWLYRGRSAEQPSQR